MLYFILFDFNLTREHCTTVCQWQFPINCWLDYDD